MRRAKTAAVAGAGIGGLCAALALARRGLDVTVAERAEAFGEVGAGVQLSPNAVHVLRALGLEEAVREVASVPEAAVIRDGRTGRRLARSRLSAAAEARYGAPYLTAHRADLHGVLAAACRSAGVRFRLGAPVTGYAPRGDGAALLAGGDALAVDVVVGADGVGSALRRQMLGDEAARYTGHAAWRALIPAAALHGGAVPTETTSWAGRGGHVVTYPLRGGALVNLVAVTRRPVWTAEGWTRTGDPKDLHAAFAGWAPPVRAVLDAAEAVTLWGLFDRPPAQRIAEGAACLLGDAAHPMLPFMAQGAAMAIEDAWVLGEALSDRDATAALAAYERQRAGRTAAVQRIAGANASLFHYEGMARAKLAVAGALPFLAARRFDAVYGLDVTRPAAR